MEMQSHQLCDMIINQASPGKPVFVWWGNNRAAADKYRLKKCNLRKITMQLACSDEASRRQTRQKNMFNHRRKHVR